MLQIVMSLTDDSRGINYDYNMCIVQAMLFNFFYNNLTIISKVWGHNFTRLTNKENFTVAIKDPHTNIDCKKFVISFVNNTPGLV